ncbi:MAG TPA: hypothetical protein VKT81_18635 [Bryobacteraceae bacterium]|nr:hypothetical protein [Bryobacteraceae bacterium]
MNRREWFLQLGAGVVLAGCSASDLDAADFPPGVFGPSRDHLSHALAGRRLAAGTEVELVQVRSGPFQPAFFQPTEYRAMIRLTAEMLGETAAAPIVGEIVEWIDRTVAESADVRRAALAMSAAHRTLAVHYYGTEAVDQLEKTDPQAICRDGLAWMGRDKSLKDVSDGSNDHAGARFFAFLKGRVADGFYTSRAGLEELGRGNPTFHASPPGCPAH